MNHASVGVAGSGAAIVGGTGADGSGGSAGGDGAGASTGAGALVVGGASPLPQALTKTSASNGAPAVVIRANMGEG
jgi:hypothetical protein